MILLMKYEPFKRIDEDTGKPELKISGVHLRIVLLRVQQFILALIMFFLMLGAFAPIVLSIDFIPLQHIVLTEVIISTLLFAFEIQKTSSHDSR